MRRRLSAAALLASTAAGLAAGATELPEAWRNWQYARAIEAGAVDTPRLVRVELPLAVQGRSREGLGDLRVIRETDEETPYLLHARPGRRSAEWRDAPLRDLGFVPGQYTEAVADAATERATHNRLELRGGASDFFARVELAASDDGTTWRLLRDGAPIYRFERDGIPGSQIVSYPETGARWLRLRVLDRDRRFPLEGCRIGFESVEAAERAAWSVTPSSDGAAPHGESRWEFGFEYPRVPVSGVRFETGAVAFHRAVTVSVQDARGRWLQVGQGEIFRFAAGAEGQAGAAREQLEIELPESWSATFRVTVFDHDDPPIVDLQPRLLGLRRWVVLPQEPGASYRLLYGNSRAQAPGYDLARLTSRDAIEAAPVVPLGREQVNAGYVSPDPWTERHAFVLWGALIVAVLVLGWLAVRALR